MYDKRYAYQNLTYFFEVKVKVLNESNIIKILYFKAYISEYYALFFYYNEIVWISFFYDNYNDN